MAGVVPVCANCDPETFVAAVRAAEARDWQQLDFLQGRIDELRKVILQGEHNWIAGLFAALEMPGIANCKPLLPLQPVGDEQRRRLAKFFAVEYVL